MPNYLDLFLEEYKEEYELNLLEGLNKTVGLGQSLSVIKKAFNNSILTSNKQSNTFSLEVDNPTKEDIDKIQSLIVNNLGWFISRVRILLDDNRTSSGPWNDKIVTILDKIESITFYFEAKYDHKIDREKIPDVLYHITPKKYWEKISKIGLVPKSRSKRLYHPDRVYLAKTIEDVEKLGPKFYQDTGEKDWSILSIDTGLIPGSYFQIYQDPNYRPNGFYTLNNIPGIAIKKVQDIQY